MVDDGLCRRSALLGRLFTTLIAKLSVREGDNNLGKIQKTQFASSINYIPWLNNWELFDLNSIRELAHRWGHSL